MKSHNNNTTATQQPGLHLLCECTRVNVHVNKGMRRGGCACIHTVNVCVWGRGGGGRDSLTSFFHEETQIYGAVYEIKVNLEFN